MHCAAVRIQCTVSTMHALRGDQNALHSDQNVLSGDRTALCSRQKHEGQIVTGLFNFRGIGGSHSIEKAWKALAKIGLCIAQIARKTRWVLACSCSQNFCYCSHARILVKIPVWHRWETLCAMIVAGNMHPRFANVLLKLWRTKPFFSKGTRKSRKEHMWSIALNMRPSELIRALWLQFALNPRNLLKFPLRWIFFSRSVCLSSKPKLEMLVRLNVLLFTLPKNINITTEPSMSQPLEVW